MLYARWSLLSLSLCRKTNILHASCEHETLSLQGPTCLRALSQTGAIAGKLQTIRINATKTAAISLKQVDKSLTMHVTFLQALQASQTKYLQGNENGAHDSRGARLQRGSLENPTYVPKAQHCLEAVRCAKSAGLKPSKWFLSRNESRKQFQVHFANAEGNKNLSIQFTISPISGPGSWFQNFVQK